MEPTILILIISAIATLATLCFSIAQKPRKIRMTVNDENKISKRLS